MKTADVDIIPFEPALADAFYAINEEWIASMFTLEQVDIDMLRHPEEKIIDGGGAIWFASHSEHGVVGTCALINQGNGAFELTKMGVLQRARGLKTGEVLLRFVIAQARQMPVDELFLLTNKRCEAAIHLYEKHGFEHDADIMRRFGTSYARCDVAMRYPGISAVG